ncbi:hypothetical protein TIFTF001_033947 [Ficus carica]|uniref:Uncharacterized protein n=1 Tax=Ficus carica TaxID=3494 RepID=A0AA88E6A3_FICCA|nr:hypothetical protein TIFTF001_022409 [Ficus carica]GMN64874.1 hypothetical protein TIFTF001_033947 [Ficus carica]
MVLQIKRFANPGLVQEHPRVLLCMDEETCSCTQRRSSTT